MRSLLLMFIFLKNLNIKFLGLLIYNVHFYYKIEKNFFWF